MGRILFVSTADSFQTPYLDKYEGFFEGEYDFLYWDRTGQGCRRVRANAIPFQHPSRTALQKLFGYFSFRKYAKRVLMEGDYSGVVLLQTQPAILLKRTLEKHYCDRYVCDVRDYAYDDVWPLRWLERSLFSNSAINVISSPGYRSFLPVSAEYHLMHNNHQGLFRKHAAHHERSIRILYLGSIRFFDQCRLMIERFSNDERFSLSFCGAGAFFLRAACSDLDISRVTFFDAFDPEKTVEFFDQCDLIFNLYGNGSPFLNYALSNKLYYSAELAKPIIVCPNTCMEDYVRDYNLGFVVDLENGAASEKLFDEYVRFDVDSFEEGRRRLLKKVDEENRETEELIRRILNQ